MARIIHENRTLLVHKSKTKLIATPHLHKAVELIYKKSGECEVYCSTQKYKLSAGGFFCAFPNQVHFYNDDDLGEHYAVIFEPERISCFTETFLKKVPEKPVCIPQDETLEQLMEILLKEYKNGADSRFLEGMVTAAFARLLPHYKLAKAKSSSDRVSQIVTYCNEHFKEDISSETVASALYLSRGYISGVFNKTLGISFTEYINSLRLDEVERLYSNGGISLSKASAVAGFPTVRTFNRAFLKKYGCSPSEYYKKEKP
ncbi:MAG: helix-turn-helix transcriptional regulator [Clostridia bacterium]|nr:helix-turn-helix transcriptional regulator [Clostridia bacterium]